MNWGSSIFTHRPGIWVGGAGWDDLLNEAEGLNGPVDVLTRKVMYLRPELFIALLGKCTSYNKTTGRVLALERTPF